MIYLQITLKFQCSGLACRQTWSEFRVQGSGFEGQSSEFRSEFGVLLLASGFWLSYFLFLISFFSFTHWAEGKGQRVQGSGFRGRSSGGGVQGSEGEGQRVKGRG